MRGGPRQVQTMFGPPVTVRAYAGWGRGMRVTAKVLAKAESRTKCPGSAGQRRAEQRTDGGQGQRIIKTAGGLPVEAALGQLTAQS